MDPNVVVLDISSDEEGGWDGGDNRVMTGGFDDNNWIAELLDEVNGGGDCGYHNGSDDSDEVVVVSELLPSRRARKKPTSKSSSLDDDDGDCVVLDHDPGKLKEVRNHNPVAPREIGDDGDDDDDDDDDDDSDDLLVVSETGQVACRDYPHPRHLCIKFPFSSSPNESHCDQCYCYVCDSLAPCLYWGNGSGAIDHCQATEKLEFWKLERQNSKSKNMTMVSLPLPPPPPPLLVQTPTVAHSPVQRPNAIRVCPVSPNLGSSNIINQNRVLFMLSRNKYQPGLVSQQLIRTSSCTLPRHKAHPNYTFNKPVFKRTASPGIASNGNRHFYSSHRDSYRRQPAYHVPENLANNPPPYLPFEEVNFDSYPESPIPLQPQLQSSLLNYEATQQENHNHGQRSIVDPKFFNGINWPESQTDHHLPPAHTATPANEPLVEADSGDLVDYRYDNWGYNHKHPSELLSVKIPGSIGLNAFSPEREPGFLDSGTIFDF